MIKKKNSQLSLKVKTKEYPGFPTDLQAQLTSSLLKTKVVQKLLKIFLKIGLCILVN